MELYSHWKRCSMFGGGLPHGMKYSRAMGKLLRANILRAKPAAFLKFWILSCLSGPWPWMIRCSYNHSILVFKSASLLYCTCPESIWLEQLTTQGLKKNFPMKHNCLITISLQALICFVLFGFVFVFWLTTHQYLAWFLNSNMKPLNIIVWNFSGIISSAVIYLKFISDSAKK